LKQDDFKVKLLPNYENLNLIMTMFCVQNIHYLSLTQIKQLLGESNQSSLTNNNVSVLREDHSKSQSKLSVHQKRQFETLSYEAKPIVYIPAPGDSFLQDPEMVFNAKSQLYMDFAFACVYFYICARGAGFKQKEGFWPAQISFCARHCQSES
jgi:hypothetical protein